MTYLTNDQYFGLSKLEKWYHKGSRQFIEISGVIGTGVWQLLQTFIDKSDLEMKEIMFLTYDQKQLLEMASKRYHTYYINSIIYNYTRFVDFNTIPVLNSNSNKLEYEWKKKVRKKVDPRYRLMVVFDSLLLNHQTINDLATFGLPIILLRDPMLLPIPNSYTFMRDPEIMLNEIHPDLIKNPITLFAHKILNEDKLKFGTYDNVSVIPRKQMNLYNLRYADMIITLGENLRNKTNEIYRQRILKRKDITNIVGERVIVMNNMHAHKLVNKDEKLIKLFLTKGLVGNISKCNKHAVNTRYVPIEFRPDGYFDSFTDLVMDRHFLNKINIPTRQIIPDETILLEYAYALTPSLSRLSHWDKVSLLIDSDDECSEDLQARLLYTAVTRAHRSLSIII